MNILKLMIVDDDVQIRDGINWGIDWSELGIRQVFTAANGIEALKLFKEHRPKIVITDVRMPGMDGLELFRSIIGLDPAAKVIIISGYSDFEYLKKAIRYGAVDYELKPIKVGSIIKLIKKIKEDIVREKATEEEFNIYRESHKARFTQDLFRGKISDRNIIIENFKQYFDFDIRSMLLCAAIEIDGCDGLFCSGPDINSDEVFGTIRNYLNNSILSPSKGILFKIEDKLFAFIYKIEDTYGYTAFLKHESGNVFKGLNIETEKKHGISASMGISSRGKTEDIFLLYKQAAEALEYKLYRGRKSLNFFENASSSAQDAGRCDNIDRDELRNCILKCDFSLIDKILRKNFNHFKKNKCHDRKAVERCVRLLIDVLLAACKANGFDADSFFDSEQWYSIPCFETVDDYRVWVTDVYNKNLDKVKNIIGQKNPMILKACEYININYANNITLSSVAGYVQKTPNYLSCVFKKEMRISFSCYLNNIRLDKAKELIKSTNLLISEIAEKVGYKDTSYFTQIFKKQTGFAPSYLRK